MLQNQNVSSYQHSYCPTVLPIRSLIYSNKNLQELDPTCWIEAPVEDYLQGGTKEQIDFQINPATIIHFNETLNETKEVQVQEGSQGLNGNFSTNNHGFLNSGTNFLHIEITSPYDLSQSLKIHQEKQSYYKDFNDEMFKDINSSFQNIRFLNPSTFLHTNNFIDTTERNSFGFLNDPDSSDGFISLYGYYTTTAPDPYSQLIPSCYFHNIQGEVLNIQPCKKRPILDHDKYEGPQLYEIPNVHARARYIKLFPNKIYNQYQKQRYSEDWEGPRGINRKTYNINNVSHMANFLYAYTDNAFKETFKTKTAPLLFKNYQTFNKDYGYYNTLRKAEILSRAYSNVPAPTRFSFLFLKIK